MRHRPSENLRSAGRDSGKPTAPPGRRRPSVALLIETSNAYARGLLAGIADYVTTHDPWSIWLPEQSRGEPPPEWLRSWKGDGIIARIETDAIARWVKRLSVPVIDLSAARAIANIPWVETDDAAIALLAVEHLAGRGFRRLGFVGAPRFNWSKNRETHFRQVCAERGIECATFSLMSDAAQGRERHRLAEWLAGLPKPIGVLACFDRAAVQLLDVCRERNLPVPDEVAVLGVDNDPLLCNLTTPSLSSVAPDARRTGAVAARMLDAMLNGEAVPTGGVFVPPLGVDVRRSTDVLAIEDRDVAAALRFIREHWREGIDVSHVLRASAVSRRSLETRFQKLLGRTPHQEITRLRLDAIRRLLADTDLSIGEIATRTGLNHPEYLAVMFRRETGVSPSDFRRTHRGG